MNEAAIDAPPPKRRLWHIFQKDDVRPGWLWLVIALTAIYLLFEFAYSARLLDAIGGENTTESLHGIEQWGRTLSGFAVALAILPLVLNAKRLDGTWKIVLASFLFLFLIPIVSHYEEKFVNSLVDSSTQEERYAAVKLMLLQRSLLSDTAKIDGLALKREQLIKPDGKAFLATFPFMLSSIEDIDKKIDEKKDAILWTFADNEYGGAIKHYNLYVDSIAALERQHKNYQNGSKRYYDSLSDIREKQDELWRKYLDSRTICEWSWGQQVCGQPRFPEVDWLKNQVRKGVQRSGVPIPDDWDCRDTYPFYAAIEKKIRRKADSKYRAEVTQQAGFYLKPGLSQDAFLKHPEIQKQWRKKMGYPDDVAFRSDLTPDVFIARIYNKLLSRSIKNQAGILNAPRRDFADGGKYEKEGRESTMLIFAPLIALLFSVAGAVAHSFKLGFFLIQAGTKRRWAGWYHKLFAIIALVSLMLWSFSTFLRSDITDQVLYRDYLYDKVVTKYDGSSSAKGWILANGIQGVIHVQPYLYPTFEKVRKGLLNGLEFGYREELR